MSRSVTIAGYVLLAVAAIAYQVAGVAGRRTATLGQVLRVVKQSLAGRALLLAVWLWVGWHVFVRGGWR